MRISNGGLLVTVAVLIPIIVELRTALSWFGITLSVVETAALGTVVVLAVIGWAVWSPGDSTGTESPRSH